MGEPLDDLFAQTHGGATTAPKPITTTDVLSGSEAERKRRYGALMQMLMSVPMEPHNTEVAHGPQPQVVSTTTKAENHDAFLNANPLDRLPQRFVHARTAVRSMPIHPGATDPPYDPADPFRDEYTDRYESGAPGGPRRLGGRWQGLYGRAYDSHGRAVDGEANTILVSRTAGEFQPEVAAHEEGHAAWRDLTDQERKQWARIHSEFAGFGNALDHETAPIQRAVAQYYDDPPHSFAQVFGEYQLNPRAMRNEDPRVYALFKKFFDGKEFINHRKGP